MRFFNRTKLGYKRAVVNVSGVDYHIRELSVQERLAFHQYSQENQGNQVILCAWLITTACDEYRRRWWHLFGPDRIDVAARGGYSWLAEMAREILLLSEMVPEKGDAKPSNVVSIDSAAEPGTVSAAKKPSGDGASSASATT